VHRDVSPQNLVVSYSGDVKVLDFGIAKIMKDGEASSTKGTFASFTWLYAAPEQLDPRLGGTGLATDVYGFALVLTEVLCDKSPVEGRDVVAIIKAATDPTLRPTPRTRGGNVPDAIEVVCRRALAVDPKARYQTMGELWAALAAARPPRTTTGSGAHHAPAPPSVVGSLQHGNSGVPTEPSPPPGTSPPRSSLASRQPASSAAQNAPIATSHPYAPTVPNTPNTPFVPMPMGPPPGGPMMAPPRRTPPPGQPMMQPMRRPTMPQHGSNTVWIVCGIIFFIGMLFMGMCTVVHKAC